MSASESLLYMLGISLLFLLLVAGTLFLLAWFILSMYYGFTGKIPEKYKIPPKNPTEKMNPSSPTSEQRHLVLLKRDANGIYRQPRS